MMFECHCPCFSCFSGGAYKKVHSEGEGNSLEATTFVVLFIAGTLRRLRAAIASALAARPAPLTAGASRRLPTAAATGRPSGTLSRDRCVKPSGTNTLLLLLLLNYYY